MLVNDYYIQVDCILKSNTHKVELFPMLSTFLHLCY